jgi:flagellar motor switch protein FliN
VITEATTAVSGMLATAAATLAATLASTEPLIAGEQTRDVTALEIGEAILVNFAGAATGELVIVMDGELAAVLANTELGSFELAQALAPTIEAVANSIGPVALGEVQTMDARLALQRVLAHTDAALVPLLGAAGPRAVIAIGLEQAAPVQAAAFPALEDIPAYRLDLLRGVEMEATAELGRTRMTVNDLLSLRTGAVIELDRVAGAAADLFVNGRLIARGEVVVIDENYGLRITQVVSDDGGR